MLFLLVEDLFELGFMFGGAAGARLGVDHAGRLGLSDAFSGVGFHSLGCGEFSWLAFRHDGCLRSSLVRTSMEYVKPEWKPLRGFV